jgi:hypothetical protein
MTPVGEQMLQAAYKSNLPIEANNITPSTFVAWLRRQGAQSAGRRQRRIAKLGKVSTSGCGVQFTEAGCYAPQKSYSTTRFRALVSAIHSWGGFKSQRLSVEHALCSQST